MSTHPKIDRICAAAAVLSLLLTVLFVNGQALGLRPVSGGRGYEGRLFDTARVHTVDIVMDGWDGFVASCEDEAYAACSVVIDREAYKNVGIRAKGNTSLRTVSAMDSDRYSFKIEFDHYESGKTYHGLDKLCLNNLIQDNTCMKDYLTYQMMAAFGVAAPLCSFVYVTVNGEDWGLYLAVEGVEDGFLQRNYGGRHGSLYKPDSMGLGGGRGNGRNFDMAEFADPGSGGMGAADVKLQYQDDDPESYSNIFTSAKTAISAADRTRLIQALKTLGQGTDIESAVDTEQILRYFAVHNFAVNGDSYTGSMVHNYYLYEQDGRLAMIPWDYNLAFGTFQTGDAAQAVNDPIDTPLSVAGDGDRPMADWIFQSETYTALYHQYLRDFLETVDPVAIIEEAAGLIAPYVERDPTKFCTVPEFQAGVDTLKTFCRLRAQSVSGQLTGAIPATRDRQAADGSALIDAAGLALSAMGSMGGGPVQTDGAAPGGTEPGGAHPPLPSPGDRGSVGDGHKGGRPPSGGPPDSPSVPAGRALLPLGGSALALAAGIVAAARYRRRGHRP